MVSAAILKAMRLVRFRRHNLFRLLREGSFPFRETDNESRKLYQNKFVFHVQSKIREGETRGLVKTDDILFL